RRLVVDRAWGRRGAARGARARPRTRVRIAFVPLGFVAGAALARVLLRYAPPDFSVDRAQPLIVVTYWQQFGALMWLALFVAIAIASLGYVTVLRAPFAQRPDGSPLRVL